MVTRDAWSLLHIPEDRSFQYRSQKSREECEDNRSRVHSVVLLCNIKRLSLWLLYSFYSDFFFSVLFSFSFIDDGYLMEKNNNNKQTNCKY